MKKGIAIQTILLLLVGVLVVGILVFLIYKYTRSSAMGCEKCKADFIAWCTTCSVSATGKGCSDWEDTAECDVNLGYFMNQELLECADECGLHSKNDKCNFGGCIDIIGVGRCGNAGVNPCIYCGAPNAQNDCKKVGVGS